MAPPRLFALYTRTLFQSSRKCTLRPRLTPAPVFTCPLSTSPQCLQEHNPNSQHGAQQDRKKMNTESNEYAKSGTDNTAAGNEDAAFDRESDPQKAKEKAGEGNEVNPLDASPANPELSQGTAEEEGGVKKKQSEGGGGRN